MYKVEIGKSILDVKKGDITKETTDAIVNLNNKTLDQDYGISKDILTAAGNSVREECIRLGKQPHSNFVVTGAGNLRCKKIIHLIDAVNKDKIVAEVKEVLKACDQHNIQSITIPAIGTGNANIGAKTSLELIMTGIEEYALGTATSCISQIHIIAYKENIYQEYIKAFEIRISGNQKYNLYLKLYGKDVTLIKGDITDQDTECIVNLTNQSLNQNCGVSAAILSAAGSGVKDECNKLAPITADQMVLTSGGNMKCKKILHLIGPTNSKAMVPALEKILEECVKHSIKTMALPAIGTGMAAMDPSDSISGIIGGLIQHFEKVTHTSLTKICIIAFTDKVYQEFSQAFKTKSFEIQESEPYSENNIEAIFRNPPTWTDMGTDEYKIIELSNSSTEFKDIEKKFLESAQSYKCKVIKIERVQNVKLWRSFSVRKLFVDSRYPNERNCKLLFHGTSIETVTDILYNGFNRSYSGKNGRYGRSSAK
ncbi:protein mono-ADP-ribosyltransferase PARP15 isoform X2 [Xenopus laevis]|uniref:Poly [ADP-ribose] polymerase n=1 Tax=Xenopus laevis TaxID=8355 RepID=A0A8J1LUH9_XENLA|nr:protein mono-ADP-ribosyltransferase PARP15 isoform X2 [Xenopus laevis]